jgi:hypothetical protein
MELNGINNSELMNELQLARSIIDKTKELQAELVAEAKRRGLHWTDKEMGLE